VADVNTIQMQTRQLHLWAENLGFEVTQCAAETIAIWLGKGDKTTQRKNNTARWYIWELFHSMSTGNKLEAGHE